LKKYNHLCPNKEEKEKSVMATKEMREEKKEKKNGLSESH